MQSGRIEIVNPDHLSTMVWEEVNHFSPEDPPWVAVGRRYIEKLPATAMEWVIEVAAYKD